MMTFSESDQRVAAGGMARVVEPRVVLERRRGQPATRRVDKGRLGDTIKPDGLRRLAARGDDRRFSPSNAPGPPTRPRALGRDGPNRVIMHARDWRR